LEESLVKTVCCWFALLSGMAWAGNAFAQVDQVMPVKGGEGGGSFVARCAGTDVLTGFDLMVADDIDSIRPICITAYTPIAASAPHVFTQKFGGDTGSPVRIICPLKAPAIVALEILAEGRETVILNTIKMYCGPAAPNQPQTPYPSAVFDAPHTGSTGYAAGAGWYTHRCGAGLVPVGITGRTGIWVDAVGLICGAMRLDTSIQPVQSIGRANRGTPAPQGPRKTICEAALDARARNSPAAANLERQCEAIKAAAPAPRAATTAVASVPRLEAPTNIAAGPSAADYEIVRARGAAVWPMDLSAAAIRNSLPPGAQRGFEVGLGVWGLQTAPGPGKQRYHDFLSPPEQQGFDAAAAYALPNNNYASLVSVGAVINKADPTVRKARNAVNDGFYWQGFDIASGLFGDPKAGSQGSKVLGSGAIAIRSSLNAAGQNGFNASMTLHLARNYR
jgi:hypothetical protein